MIKKKKGFSEENLMCQIEIENSETLISKFTIENTLPASFAKEFLNFKHPEKRILVGESR